MSSSFDADATLRSYATKNPPARPLPEAATGCGCRRMADRDGASRAVVVRGRPRAQPVPPAVAGTDVVSEHIPRGRRPRSSVGSAHQFPVPLSC